MNTVEPPSIYHIAAGIKNAYIKKRWLTDATYQGHNKELDNATLKAAEICSALSADPEDFVEAQFEFKSSNVPEFYPKLLHTNNSEDNYRRYLESKRSRIALSFEIQKAYLWKYLNQGKTAEEILADPTIDFKPWFRVIITKDPIPQVMATYQKAAKESVNKALLEFLQTLQLDLSRLT